MSKAWKDKLLAIGIAILLSGISVIFGRWSKKADNTAEVLKDHFKTEIKNEVKQEIQPQLDSKVSQKEFNEFKNTVKTDIQEIKEDQKYIRNKADDIYTLIFELK